MPDVSAALSQVCVVPEEMLGRRRVQSVPSRLPNLSPNWVGDALEPNETTGETLAWMVRSCLAIDPISRPQSATLARIASALGFSSHPREASRDMEAEPVVPATAPAQIPRRDEPMQEDMSLDAILDPCGARRGRMGAAAAAATGASQANPHAAAHGYGRYARRADDMMVTPPAGPTRGGARRCSSTRMKLLTGAARKGYRHPVFRPPPPALPLIMPFTTMCRVLSHALRRPRPHQAEHGSRCSTPTPHCTRIQRELRLHPGRGRAFSSAAAARRGATWPSTE